MELKDIKNCVYRFINDKEDIIYIGKASNLIKRLRNHNHLPKECYEERKIVEFITFETEEEMNIAERYFIAKIKPKYNIEFSKNDIYFKIENLDSALWKIYNPKEIEKEKVIKEKIKLNVIVDDIDYKIKELEIGIKFLKEEFLKTERESNEEALLRKLINLKINEVNKIKKDKIEKLLFINDLKCEDEGIKKIYIKYYSIDHEEIKMKAVEEIKKQEFKKIYDEINENGFYSRVDLYEKIGFYFRNAGTGLKLYEDRWEEFIKDKQESEKIQIKLIKDIEQELEDTFGEFYDDIYYFEELTFSPFKIKDCKIVRRLK